MLFCCGLLSILQNLSGYDCPIQRRDGLPGTREVGALVAWPPAGLVSGSNTPWDFAHPSSKTENVFLASASCVPWKITLVAWTLTNSCFSSG